MARAGASATPPVPPPRALVPFVHFSRLPDKVLVKVRRVLDDDPEFRAQVRAAVTEEEVGAAGWLFLARPPGWEEELASSAQEARQLRLVQAEEQEERTALRRLAGAEEAAREAQKAAADLGAELSRTTQQLTDERRARRAVETDAGRLRARVAALERDLLAARDAVAPPAPQATTPREEEWEDGAPEAAPPPAAAPEPPPSDEAEVAQALAAAAAAVRVLAEAVSVAAAELAPFLPPPPPASQSPTPAEARTRRGRRRSGSPFAGRLPAPLPPGVPDNSPEAGEHLVRLPDAVVLVDGYNVTKLGRPDLALPEQRRWLTDAAAALAARSGADIDVVFDGAEDDGGIPAERPRRSKVRVRWSPAGVEADDVLLELVEGMAAGRPVVVVSNDRRVQSGARLRGANVLGSDLFLGLLGHRPPG